MFLLLFTSQNFLFVPPFHYPLHCPSTALSISFSFPFKSATLRPNSTVRDILSNYLGLCKCRLSSPCSLRAHINITANNITCDWQCNQNLSMSECCSTHFIILNCFLSWFYAFRYKDRRYKIHPLYIPHMEMYFKNETELVMTLCIQTLPFLKMKFKINNRVEIYIPKKN